MCLNRGDFDPSDLRWDKELRSYPVDLKEVYYNHRKNSWEGSKVLPRLHFPPLPCFNVELKKSTLTRMCIVGNPTYVNLYAYMNCGEF